MQQIIAIISWPVDWLISWRDYFEERSGPLLDTIPLWIKPNDFSYARIILTAPICYLLFWQHDYVFGFILYLVACLTDFFDGALARHRNQCTVFGERLDPIADKILNCTIFACFWYFFMEKYPEFQRILATNIGIDTLTTILALLLIICKGRCGRSNRFGKVKFGFQCAGIMFLIIQFAVPALFSLYAAAVSGIASFAGYILIRRA